MPHPHPADAPASDTRIDFLYLSEPDMIRAGVTDMAACVDTMSDMLGLFAEGDYRTSSVTCVALDEEAHASITDNP